MEKERQEMLRLISVAFLFTRALKTDTLYYGKRQDMLRLISVAFLKRQEMLRLISVAFLNAQIN